jgi:hypothetical protein
MDTMHKGDNDDDDDDKNNFFATQLKGGKLKTRDIF